MREYCVYILSSRSRTLYIGVSGNMARRLAQHHAATAGYTARYRVTRLVHLETFGDPRSAIAREKQLKGWRRARKIALVTAKNPAWDDLAP